MRVTCETVDEFIECLRAECQAHSTIFQDTIRVSICRRPIDKSAREALKFEVVLQASAVVVVDQESQYLLEVGEYCGKDYADDPPNDEGTQKAKALKEKIEDFAKGWWRQEFDSGASLKILPGMIHT